MQDILSNYDNDEKSRQMEELSQANHELLEQNEKLRRDMDAAEEEANFQIPTSQGTSNTKKQQAANDNLHAEMVIELNEQIDEVKLESEKLKQSLKLATAGEALTKKEIQGLKYDNKRMTMDIKDSKDRFENVKMDY